MCIMMFVFRKYCIYGDVCFVFACCVYHNYVFFNHNICCGCWFCLIFVFTVIFFLFSCFYSHAVFYRYVSFVLSNIVSTMILFCLMSVFVVMFALFYRSIVIVIIVIFVSFNDSSLLSYILRFSVVFCMRLFSPFARHFLAYQT